LVVGQVANSGSVGLSERLDPPPGVVVGDATLLIGVVEGRL
jgi:hypothetical protein